MEDRDTDAADFDEFRARWGNPVARMTVAEHQAAIEERAAIVEDNERNWRWPTEWNRRTQAERDSARRASVYASESLKRLYKEYGDELPRYQWGFPVGTVELDAVLAAPDDDAPRRAFSSWLQTIDSDPARATALFIDRSLELFRAWER
ncbi:MAG TPA: hypothetical protein VGC41_27225, partial [Kofleriaceae bacterium]